MPTVARINVTPVKSMALLHPERVTVTELGLAENRRFFLVDRAGFLFNGSDAPSLMRVRPSYDAEGERLVLRFPEDRVVEGASDDVGEHLVVDFYGRAVPGRVVKGPFAGAISSFIGRDVRLVRSDRPGDGYDIEPLTIVSDASVARLGRDGGADALDARRFRMNLELDGCEPYEEDTWAGRSIRVGDVVLDVVGQVPRCVVTTLDPDTGEKDFPTLTVIARTRERVAGSNGLPFGMYARVREPGEIAVGSSVEPGQHVPSG